MTQTTATQQASDKNAIRPFQVNVPGHFAAWEQPKFLSEELRAGFRSLRSQ
ncbi:MAG TPA: hypothetical protein VLG74_08865 [Blastocatellia bacterium]|nr:hypothetical protein [Blastocatellia bacterium]